MLEDFRLRVFMAVSKEGSFTKAAAVMNISQPAVSQHISELEKLTGVKLFERLRGEVKLTEPGKLFQIRAKEILAAYSSASSLFSPFSSAIVRVRASEEVYLYINKALELFTQIHPEVQFLKSDDPDSELMFSLLPAHEQKSLDTPLPNQISMLRLCAVPSDTFSQTDLCKNLLKCLSDLV